MYALIGTPGSPHFAYYGPASLKECEAWIARREREYRERYGDDWEFEWERTCYPCHIIPGREAYAFPYIDRSKNCKTEKGERPWLNSESGTSTT